MKKLIVLLIVGFVAQHVVGQNLVSNGEFENGMTNWSSWIVDSSADWAEPPTANADFSIVSPGLGNSANALFVQVIEPGKFDWYILLSKPVALNKNEMYELLIKAKSNQNRTISVGAFADISSGSTFFQQTISINDEDLSYGPFPFLFEVDAVYPGIKINFGGLEGDVTIDDVVIRKINTESDDAYVPSNSLDDIIGDITLPHEGWPHGVPDSYDWSKKPRVGAQNPPDGWTAAIAWGQLYEWVEGNPASNTRVQIRDMEMWYLSKSDHQWHQLQKSLSVEGAAFREDFVDDISKPADERTEPDGSVSVTAGDGFNFHFWPSVGRVEIPVSDVEGAFVTVQSRLILNDPNGVDDRDQAKYLMSVGGDWWQSLSAVWDNWETNWDMGIGRFRFIGKEWQGHNLITLPEEKVRENPPPFVGSETGFEQYRMNEEDEFQINVYPNPFSNFTTIEYQLNEAANVQLIIFDSLGRKISCLIDEGNDIGNYSVEFHGETQKKGIYYYQFIANNRVSSGKMLLVN
ncbi:MAG: T9SS type A sorting domain-containing protein [Prolixibacteraceae bacterium]